MAMSKEDEDPQTMTTTAELAAATNGSKNNKGRKTGTTKTAHLEPATEAMSKRLLQPLQASSSWSWLRIQVDSVGGTM